MFVFRKIWRALFSCNTRFEIRPLLLQSPRSSCNQPYRIGCPLYLREIGKVLMWYFRRLSIELASGKN